MNTKESFVHFHARHSHPGIWALGFTARIVPLMRDLEDGTIPVKNQRGDVMCKFAITFCNPKDKHWCKAIGREEVKLKELKEVRARDLPKLLSEAHHKAIYGNDISVYYGNVYDYVLRRFV